MEFYASPDGLALSVAEHLAPGLLAGGMAVVLATPEHLRPFEGELEAASIDVRAARASGKLLCLDAAETLASFASGGTIDAEKFDQTVGEVMRAACADGGPVRAYGEMVALLWEAGNVLGAIELEELWNARGEELWLTPPPASDWRLPVRVAGGVCTPWFRSPGSRPLQRCRRPRYRPRCRTPARQQILKSPRPSLPQRSPPPPRCPSRVPVRSLLPTPRLRSRWPSARRSNR